MSKAPFVVNPELTAVALAYRNKAAIADLVLPRVTVGTQEYKWTLFNKDERFTLPDTRVGRKGKPNEVEFGATEQTSTCYGYGLDDVVPQDDLDNARGANVGGGFRYDPLASAAQGITDLITLGREKRVADLVFDAANYPAANKETLSGTDQFSDFANSDPIGKILAAMDAMFMRGNTIVMGRAAWTKLAQHPDIVKAVHGNSGDSGIARRQAVADLFEVDQILVGESYINSAKKGQTASFDRLWGKHLALLYLDSQVDATDGSRLTFGWSAQWGSRFASTRPDPDCGLKGGQRVRVGEYMDEKIAAADVGYLFTNAVA